MELPANAKDKYVIRVGTRKSELALIQTETVISKLKEFYENNTTNSEQQFEFSVVSMSTAGDKILNKPLPQIGTKSLFTKELEVALLDGRVDMIVHSLKDLPTTLPQGCSIGAVLKRDDPNDAVVLKESLRSKINPLDLLLGKCNNRQGTHGLKIGTSSQRRIAMIRRCNKNLDCIDIRGNLNTRLSRLDRIDSEYTALVLAKAGLDRMGWADRSSYTLSPENSPDLSDWFYAVGQGAIAVECRADDLRTLNLLAPIVDLRTTLEVVAERSFMKKLEGGCSVPLGVRSSWVERDLTLRSGLLSLDGQNLIKADGTVTLPDLNEKSCVSSQSKIALDLTGITLTGSLVEKRHAIDAMNLCFELGVEVANKVIDLGGLDIIRDLR